MTLVLVLPERRRPPVPMQWHRDIKAGLTRGPNLTAFLAAGLLFVIVAPSVLVALWWLVR